MIIIPGILTDDYNIFERQWKIVEKIAPRIQIDLIDGRFVDNQTFNIDNIPSNKFTGHNVEIHLMANYPSEYFAVCEELKTKICYFHYESNEPIDYVIKAAQKYSFSIGLAINPETEIDQINQDVYSKIDHVLIMSVFPGKQGNSFLPETIIKLNQLKERFHHLNVGFDGGINKDTVNKIVATKADFVVIGSALFGYGDPEMNYNYFNMILNEKK